MTEGIVAVDIGGTGSRARWRSLAGPWAVEVRGRPVSVTRHGTSVGESVRSVLADLGQNLDVTRRASTRALCVGATGILGLTPDLEGVRRAAHETFPGATILLTSDAVCATIGALGGNPGGVIAAGTGATALGTDLDRVWHTVDGWGHLFGDAGAGSWIGRTALTLAAEQYDGRRKDAAALLTAMSTALGPVTGWPGVLYTSDQRAGILASLAPRVEELAGTGDAVSTQVCREAGSLLGRTLVAAFVDGVPLRASWTGALLRESATVRDGFVRTVQERRPDLALSEPIGSALDGATHLAQSLADSPGAPAVAHTRLATWYPAAEVSA